jgi:hypothetical protein
MAAEKADIRICSTVIFITNSHRLGLFINLSVFVNELWQKLVYASDAFIRPVDVRTIAGHFCFS